MKKSVIKSAKTVEEAVKLALKELNTTEDKVDINIIEQPSSGFLGIIGVKPAIIKVVEKDDRNSNYSLKSHVNVANKHRETKKTMEKPAIKVNRGNKKDIDIVDFVQQICNKIVAGCVVKKQSEDEEGLYLTIAGDDIGLIVGKHGETLNSIQYLAAMVYSRQQGSYKRVSVDAGGYRERREKKIIEFGNRMAQKASRTGRRISLEPMNSYERRIVHMALQEVEGISTFSEGEEPNRRVVIAPANERSSNRYNRSNRKYNNSNSKDDNYRKDRRNKTSNRSSNRPSNDNTRSNKNNSNKNYNSNNNKNNNNKVKPKKDESNPYEHYYSKYDNRYKK